MTIDIDTLTEAELIALNNRIVARLRFLQEGRAHAAMLAFRVGERVSFQPVGQPLLTGVVYPNPADNSLSANTRYNALISLPSEGAWPWCRICFSTSWR
jgi:hypothetical protein